MLFMRKTTALPSAAEALPGRAAAIPTATTHYVNGERLKPPYPAGLEQAVRLPPLYICPYAAGGSPVTGPRLRQSRP